MLTIISNLLIFIGPAIIELFVDSSNKRYIRIWFFICLFAFIITITLNLLLDNFNPQKIIMFIQYLSVIWMFVRSLQLKHKTNIKKYCLTWGLIYFNIITFAFFPIKLIIDLPIFRFTIFPNIPNWLRVAPIHFLIANIPVLISIINDIKSRNETVSDKIIRFSTKYKISKREQDILEQIINGYSNKEIGEILFISVPTVKSHILNIYKKTNSSTRGQLNSLFNNF